jgi:large subunit ribosomal protein L22
MEVRASVTGVRVSPRKARLVVDAVRGKRVMDAISLTGFLPQKTAKDVNKLLVSLAANAENNFDMDPELLWIKEIYANEGPRRPPAFAPCGAAAGQASSRGLPTVVRRTEVGGKSDLRRAVRRVTPGQGNLTDSGTEKIPPAFALRRFGE